MARLCEGRVALVTGAARGVGREHALLLAKHGAKVVVNDLGGERDGKGADLTPAQQVVAEIKAMGGEAVVNGDDVSDWNGAKRMVDQAISTFGKLDVVLSNAGILRDRMLTNMTEEEWDAVIKVHLKGTFAPARHACAYWRDKFKETGQPVNGRLLTTTSVSGIYGNVGQTNYGAAKAGIAAFTVIAARVLAGGSRAARSQMGGADRGVAGERGIRRHHRPRLPGRQRPDRRRRGLAQGPDDPAGRRSDDARPDRQGHGRQGAQERRHGRHGSGLTSGRPTHARHPERSEGSPGEGDSFEEIPRCARNDGKALK
jgi:NAD(P)-dependent dehydrogenase (short-subunit alcohol dehydrogenase family)